MPPLDATLRRYPLTTYNFRVEVLEVALSFTEVSGIELAYDHVVYKHGLSFCEGPAIETAPADQFIPVKCKRGTIPGGDPLFLYRWLTERVLRSVSVTLCDASGAGVLRWAIRAAVPTKLTAPRFGAATNEPSIDSLDLMAKGVSLVEL